MAITQTSTLELQYSRELVTLTDGFGMQRKLYIHASQVANRTTIIATKVAEMEANEANMAALEAAYNAAQAVPPSTPAVSSPSQ